MLADDLVWSEVARVLPNIPAAHGFSASIARTLTRVPTLELPVVVGYSGAFPPCHPSQCMHLKKTESLCATGMTSRQCSKKHSPEVRIQKLNPGRAALAFSAACCG
jgi:hypothetical protein